MASLPDGSCATLPTLEELCIREAWSTVDYARDQLRLARLPRLRELFFVGVQFMGPNTFPLQLADVLSPDFLASSTSSTPNGRRSTRRATSRRASTRPSSSVALLPPARLDRSLATRSRRPPASRTLPPRPTPSPSSTPRSASSRLNPRPIRPISSSFPSPFAPSPPPSRPSPRTSRRSRRSASRATSASSGARTRPRASSCRPSSGGTRAS